jgi:hypothetical protein
MSLSKARARGTSVWTRHLLDDDQRRRHSGAFFEQGSDPVCAGHMVKHILQVARLEGLRFEGQAAAIDPSEREFAG